VRKRLVNNVFLIYILGKKSTEKYYADVQNLFLDIYTAVCFTEYFYCTQTYKLTMKLMNI